MKRGNVFLMGMRAGLLAFVIVMALSACNNDEVVGGGNSAATSTGNEREMELKSKIIGTWITYGGYTWTFDADGVITSSDPSFDYYFYAINDTSLALSSLSNPNISGGGLVYLVFMSPNNKTMILNRTSGNNTYFRTLVSEGII